MKIFLSSIAILILLLTIIDKVANRFRPVKQRNNTLIIIGIVLTSFSALAVLASCYFAGDLSHLPKLALPLTLLVLLVIQYK
ncbi:MAG: hypothetical protein IPP49_10855 [Saprospiraceae bacterium]|nr:hypothetical protein [Saprospiraceae bacterium]